MEIAKKLPLNCPSCDSRLRVKSLYCGVCETNVDGLYQLPLLAQLTNEEQNFVVQFLKSSGSIKEIAAQKGVSYPTMRNTLDDLIEKVTRLENQSK